jgi:hypothetical protein
MNAEPLFVGFTDEAIRDEAERYAAASPDQRRTIRQQADLRNGVHPATKQPLADNGETCGSCAHHWVNEWTRGRRFHKCDLMEATHGPGSDIRVSWPACASWEVVDV